MSESGKHLGAVRKWIQWNCSRGEQVTWGSTIIHHHTSTCPPFIGPKLDFEKLTMLPLDIRQNPLYSQPMPNDESQPTYADGVRDGLAAPDQHWPPCDNCANAKTLCPHDNDSDIYKLFEPWYKQRQKQTVTRSKKAWAWLGFTSTHEQLRRAARAQQAAMEAFHSTCQDLAKAHDIIDELQSERNAFEEEVRVLKNND